MIAAGVPVYAASAVAAAPLTCQRPASQIAGGPPGLGATAQLEPEREGGGEVVAGQVSAEGQQACPPAVFGAGGNTAKVKRDDVDIGDHQVPAGSQDGLGG